MDILLGIFTALLFLVIIGLGFNHYFHAYRNTRVHEFLISILEDSSIEQSKKMEIINSLPSYDGMVYSFKPIKLESWYKEKIT
jgi:hypothetical protein